MAKKLHFALLLCTVTLTFTSVFATNGLDSVQTKVFETDVCNAPPPNNFQITSIGATFISLAWQPVEVGALYTLEVLEKDSSGGWNALFVADNIPDSTYMVDSLDSGKAYQFKIRTKCNNGEPSELSSIKDGITLILELTTEGRKPRNPIPVDCDNIPLNHEWVGFRVDHFQNGISFFSFFEFAFTNEEGQDNIFESKIKIKRVQLTNSIVAVDPGGFYPTELEPEIPSPIPFRMDRLLINNPDRDIFGFVQILEKPNSGKISICPDYFNSQQPWKNNYSFTAMVADQVFGLLPPSIDERAEVDMGFGKIKVQSPFKESLNVILPNDICSENSMVFRLINTNGQTVMDQSLEITGTNISFPLFGLSSGIYILIVENRYTSQAFKVLKY